MDRNWEVFTERKTRIARNPTMTIQKQGAISINEPAYRALGEPAHVELLYDSASQSIGLRPSKEDVPYAYPIRAQGNSRSYRVAAKAFFDYYRIDLSNTRRYDATIESDVLVADLRSEAAIFSRRSTT